VNGVTSDFTAVATLTLTSLAVAGVGAGVAVLRRFAASVGPSITSRMPIAFVTVISSPSHTIAMNADINMDKPTTGDERFEPIAAMAR